MIQRACFSQECKDQLARSHRSPHCRQLLQQRRAASTRSLRARFINALPAWGRRCTRSGARGRFTCRWIVVLGWVVNVKRRERGPSRLAIRFGWQERRIENRRGKVHSNEQPLHEEERHNAPKPVPRLNPRERRAV